MPDHTQDSIYLFLGRIEGKLDASLQRIQETEEKIKGHESRLRAIETRTSYVLGAASIISLGTPYALSQLGLI